MKVLLSGIQPTGTLHIGNYLGAIAAWVELQSKYTTYIAIVDAHAIAVPQEPKILRENTLKTAALLVACGIDPKKSVLFLQSHVPAHFELAWILTTITPVGELERMTQYKDKSQKIKDKSGALAGLLNYPVLQSADILLYQADAVPVGEDQLQHLELTRALARRFNNRFGRTFKEPQPLVQKDAARIMGLDDPTKKMSKSAASDANYVSLLDSPEVIRRKIKTAVTDSGRDVRFDRAKKPAISNLMTMYSAFSGLPYSAIEKKYANRGYADFKHDLAELLVEKLSLIQKKYSTLVKNQKSLKTLLVSGAASASRVADKTLADVKKKVGFVI